MRKVSTYGLALLKMGSIPVPKVGSPPKMLRIEHLR